MTSLKAIHLASPVLGGILGAWFALPGEESAAFPSLPAHATETAAPSSRARMQRSECLTRPTARALNEVRRQTEVLRAALGSVEQDIDALLGPPLDLDLDPEHPWAPRNARETLLSELEDVPGAELYDVRCPTEPCVAVIQFTKDGPDKAAILEALGLDPGTPTHTLGDGARETTWSLTVPLTEMPDNPDWSWVRRVHHLVDRTGENVQREQ